MSHFCLTNSTVSVL